MFLTIRKMRSGLEILLSINILIYNYIFSMKNPFKNEFYKNNNTCKQKFIETTIDNEFSQELYMAIEEARKKLNIPSIQVSIITNDNGIFTCSCGLANVEKKEEATLDSVYYLGSITKLYTHAVILKLEQDNLLSLEDPVSKYIDISNNGRNVTISHLLYHSSGLFDPLKDAAELFKLYYCGKKWSDDKILKEVRNNKPYFEPGKGRKYSNTGYILLGIIAERVTKKTFSQLLEQLFLEQFKLTNTYYSYQSDLPSNLATGYDRVIYKLGKIGLRANIEQFPIHLPTASLTSGGLVSSSSDVCHFLYNLFESNILSDENKRRLRLFFNLSRQSSEILRVHLGNIVGYNNFIGYSSSKNLYFVILSNESFISDRDKLQIEVVEKIISILHNNGTI